VYVYHTITDNIINLINRIYTTQHYANKRDFLSYYYTRDFIRIMFGIYGECVLFHAWCAWCIILSLIFSERLGWNDILSASCVKWNAPWAVYLQQHLIYSFIISPSRESTRNRWRKNKKGICMCAGSKSATHYYLT